MKSQFVSVDREITLYYQLGVYPESARREPLVPTMFLLHSSVFQLLGPSCFAPRVDSVAKGGELGVEVPLCPSNLMPQDTAHMFSLGHFPQSSPTL